MKDLMQKRVKVIADYPQNPKPIGTIIPEIRGYYEVREGYSIKAELISDYPAIFKPLEWWEERSDSEMPQYVKLDDGVHESVIIKPTSWAIVGGEYCVCVGQGAYMIRFATPATLTDYTTFKNK